MDYLLQARQITDGDAHLILSKVPQPIHVDPAPAPSTAALVQAGSSLQLTNLPTPILNSNVQPVASPAAQSPQLSQTYSGAGAVAVAKRAVPPPPNAPAKKVQARALWDYNVDGDVRGPVLLLSDLNPFRLCYFVIARRLLARPAAHSAHPRGHSHPCYPLCPLFSISFTVLPAIAILPCSHPRAHPYSPIPDPPILTAFPLPTGTKRLDVLQRRHHRDYIRGERGLVDG